MFEMDLKYKNIQKKNQKDQFFFVNAILIIFFFNFS